MNLNHCFLINYTKRTINSLKLKKNRLNLIRLFFRLIIKNNYYINNFSSIGPIHAYCLYS